MKKYGLIGFLGAVFFALSFSFALSAHATPGTAVISRGVENAYGEFPEVDGYLDRSLQDRVNSHMKAAANDLRSNVKTRPEINYSYHVVKNSLNFLSIIIKADSQGMFAGARSINLDPRSGNPYGLNELFIANEGFFDALETKLGWRPNEKSPFALSDKGLVFVRETDGQELTVNFEDVFEWVDTGRSPYYLTTYYLTEAANGKLLRVKKGNLVIIRLESNKSSGYVWQSASNDYEQQLKYIGSSYLLRSADMGIGTGGWDLIVYGAKQEGETFIELQQKRPWQNQILNTVKIQIICEG